MTFIILSILGILAAIFAGSNWSKKVQIRFVIIVIIIGVILIIAPYTKSLILKMQLLLGRPHWIDIIFYFSMLTGMLTSYFFDYFKYKNKRKYEFRNLIAPLAISPIIFLTFYGVMKNCESVSIFFLTFFSFQNGFFWYTIFEKEKTK